MGFRGLPFGLVICVGLTLLVDRLTLKAAAFGGLSDFGGDVSQYMTLLQGSSAFRLVATQGCQMVCFQTKNFNLT
jgi:hypothetical protein